MRPIDLWFECAQCREAGLHVTLTIPKGSYPRGFPRGELLNEMERGGVVERTYRFDPRKLAAFLTKNNLIGVYSLYSKPIV